MSAELDRMHQLELRLDQCAERLEQLELLVPGFDSTYELPPGIFPPLREFGVG